MAISRRQFFRGLVRQGDDKQSESERRKVAVESYVRTNLLPYDFGLTAEQTAEVLGAAVAAADIAGDSELFNFEGRTRLRDIVEEKIQTWREEYQAAEIVRADAIAFVREFLVEATPEQVEALQTRFQLPYPADFNDTIERETRVWLCGLPNAMLAHCAPAELKELVFSQIRSWC
jgi:hypothetical protein